MEKVKEPAEPVQDDPVEDLIDPPENEPAAVVEVPLPEGTRPEFGRLEFGSYESRNPNFTAGGTAYVRALCPECSEPMFFSVDTDVEFTNKGGERKLKPVFKAKTKPHACHQQVAELDGDVPTILDEPEDTRAPDERLGLCPCTECVGGCDSEAEEAGPERSPLCAPCRMGEHVEEAAEEPPAEDLLPA